MRPPPARPVFVFVLAVVLTTAAVLGTPYLAPSPSRPAASGQPLQRSPGAEPISPAPPGGLTPTPPSAGDPASAPGPPTAPAEVDLPVLLPVARLGGWSPRVHGAGLSNLLAFDVAGRLWSASVAGTVCVWDASGALVRAWRAHDAPLAGMALTPAGVVTVGRRPLALRLWDRQGVLLREVRLDVTPDRLGVTADGRFAAITSLEPPDPDERGMPVSCVDLAAGTVTWSLRVAMETAWTVVADPAGGALLVGGDGGLLAVDPLRGDVRERAWLPRGHTVYAASVDAGSRRVAASVLPPSVVEVDDCDDDDDDVVAPRPRAALVVWSADDGALVARREVDEDEALGELLLVPGGLLVTRHGAVELRRLPDLEVAWSRRPDDEAGTPALSHDGQTVAWSEGRTGRLQVAALATGELIPPTAVGEDPGHSGHITGLAFRPDGGELLSVDVGGEVIRRRAGDWRVQRRHPVREAAGVWWDRSGARFAVGARDDAGERELQVWDVTSDAPALRLPTGALAAAFTPAGDRLLTFSPFPRRVRLFDALGGVVAERAFADGRRPVGVTEDLHVLVAEDGRVDLEAAEDGRVVGSIPLGDGVTAVWAELSPDGATLALERRGAPGVWLHDARTGAALGRAEGVRVGAWLPGGRAVVVVDGSRVDLVDATGRAVARLGGLDHAPVTELAASPDGRWLVVGGFAGGALLVWDLAGR